VREPFARRSTRLVRDWFGDWPSPATFVLQIVRGTDTPVREFVRPLAVWRYGITRRAVLLSSFLSEERLAIFDPLF